MKATPFPPPCLCKFLCWKSVGPLGLIGKQPLLQGPPCISSLPQIIFSCLVFIFRAPSIIWIMILLIPKNYWAWTVCQTLRKTLHVYSFSESSPMRSYDYPLILQVRKLRRWVVKSLPKLTQLANGSTKDPAPPSLPISATYQLAPHCVLRSSYFQVCKFKERNLVVGETWKQAEEGKVIW